MILSLINVLITKYPEIEWPIFNKGTLGQLYKGTQYEPIQKDTTGQTYTTRHLGLKRTISWDTK